MARGLAARNAKAAGLGPLQVLAELLPGDRAHVHLVGPVRETQRAHTGVHLSEREVVAHTRATMYLNRAIDDPQRDARGDHLDGGDLGTRAAGADVVDHPG